MPVDAILPPRITGAAVDLCAYPLLPSVAGLASVVKRYHAPPLYFH
jgi:hypothetical protein